MAIILVTLAVIGISLIAFCNEVAEFISNHLPAVKRLLLCFVAVVVMLAAFVFLPPAKAEVDFYPAAAIVVSFDASEGTIFLEDGEGNIFELFWEFEDGEPVELGDVFSLLMWEAGTPTNRLDDEIIDAMNSRIKAQ